MAQDALCHYHEHGESGSRERNRSVRAGCQGRTRMKCRICGCEAPAGAKLCKDCAAARKRAFAATVTQPLILAAAGAPSVGPPRFSLKPARPKNPKPTAKSIPKS